MVYVKWSCIVKGAILYLRNDIAAGVACNRWLLSGKTLRAGNNAVKALFPVENFWESTTGVLSEIDSEKRKTKIDFCFILSSTIHSMAARSFPNGCQ
jgi:hypothetical protein